MIDIMKFIMDFFILQYISHRDNNIALLHDEKYHIITSIIPFRENAFFMSQIFFTYEQIHF